MTDKDYLMRFSWGPRQETLDECTDRLRSLVSDLASLNERFLRWKWSEETKTYQVPLEKAQVRKHLENGVNRGDSEVDVIPELGFSVALYTNIASVDDAPIRMGFRCGLYCKAPPNNCFFSIPSDDSTEKLLNCLYLVKMAKVIIRNLEPDEGLITSYECSSIVMPQVSKNPEAGWITYLSYKFKLPSELPKDWNVEKQQNGQIIILTNDVFSASNPGHMTSAKKLQKMIDQACKTK